MDIYLPIAGLSVNVIVIVMLGAVVGLLSGMLGVGGGFLTSPILIFYGIPSNVAVASAATQIAGTSVSGMLAHRRRKGVDYQMGSVLVAGGMVGSAAGGAIFRLLQKSGQIDTVISLLYVVLLGFIGLLMAKEAATELNLVKPSPRARAPRRHNPLIASLPMRWRFYRSGLYISPLAPLLVGFATGILTVLLGVGGVILIPAMIYILGMSTAVVVGTSLFQMLFVAAVTTLIHATTTKSVDVVLAVLLLSGSVIGAQIGARFAQKVRPELLRMALAVIILAIAFRLVLGLVWRPPEIYSVDFL